MKTVYKYPIIATDDIVINLPKGAEVLCVQTQGNEPFIWALVDPEEPLEPRRFRMAGTGHPIEETDLTYRGTFQLQGGALVFHLFERCDKIN